MFSLSRVELELSELASGHIQALARQLTSQAGRSLLLQPMFEWASSVKRIEQRSPEFRSDRRFVKIGLTFRLSLAQVALRHVEIY